jgi:hypothetical protein
MTSSADARPHIRLRLQPSHTSRVGISLIYAIERGYDLRREFELFLEFFFLPFALKNQGDTQAGLDAAYDSIGYLSGRIEILRELYQIAKVEPGNGLGQNTSLVPNQSATEPEVKPKDDLEEVEPQEDLEEVEWQDDLEVEPAAEPMTRPEFDLLNSLVNLP